MNYMKILLLYMAATLSLAVQNTAAPVETPVPTPPAVVEQQAQESPAAGQSGTAAVTPAAPSETPPPVPAITPNRRYRNLAKGDKGAEVKKLQERLIELGYLPAGSADGAYGNQTYKAVRNFQYYNGLARDGIAGKQTQTYLFENPDVNPYPTPTPASTPTSAPTPTPAPVPEEPRTPEPIGTPEPAASAVPEASPAETPTEAPTEEPAAVPTEVPTEEPTAVPTEEPTAAPTEAPTAAPTEAPTAEPTAVPTEAPTAVPTETPTEEPTATPTIAPTATPSPTPEPTPARTVSAPVTSVPATEAPVSRPTMTMEDVDLEELHFHEASGSVAYNETGAPLSWLSLEDGVQVLRKPRLQRQEGKVRVSLDDLAACLEAWVLTDGGNSVVLEAEGHTLALLDEEAGLAATVDARELEVTEGDFDFGEGHFIDAEFLATALGGRAVWVEDEYTLMLRFPAGD